MTARQVGVTPIQPLDRLSLSCSAGVRFLPGLKAGVSSEELMTAAGAWRWLLR